jgi:alpha-1,2-mannosyltransferase
MVIANKLANTPANKLYVAFALVAAALLLVEVETGVRFAMAQSFSGVVLEPTGFQIGRDFLNTWMGGRSAFAGGPAAWFDFTTYNEAVRQVTGHPDLPPLFWSYPPQILLFVWPFGLLPYLPAYVLWCLGGLALYIWAAIAGGVERRHAVFLAVAPAVAVTLFFGQNGFLTAALLIGGLANLERRPIVSGLLFGILTFKPQFVLLLPVLLVMTGRWRAIAAAVATTALLIVATSVWFGFDVWVAYVQKVVPQQHWLLMAAGNHGWPIVSSAFVNARLIGLPADWAWAIQAISSCCALAAIVWTYARRRDPILSRALFVTATFLFSPWMLNYDMVVFGYVVALLRQRDDNLYLDHGLALAVWTLPVMMVPFGFSHFPLAPIVLSAFAGRLIWRLARGEARRPAASKQPIAVLGDLAAQERA